MATRTAVTATGLSCSLGGTLWVFPCGLSSSGDSVTYPHIAGSEVSTVRSGPCFTLFWPEHVLYVLNAVRLAGSVFQACGDGCQVSRVLDIMDIID